jgi:integrase
VARPDTLLNACGLRFPSLIKLGKVPIWTSTFVNDHLRPAAKRAGVKIADGQRFGTHNFRHSLATWLANAEEGRAEDRTGHAEARERENDARPLHVRAVGLGSRLVQCLYG